MTEPRSRFDRLADRIARAVAHWGFFAACCMLVLGWLAQGVVRIALDGWQAFMSNEFQLEINTTTTIVTFLLVALLHNDQHRFERAVNERLQEILSCLPTAQDPVEDAGQHE